MRIREFNIMIVVLELLSEEGNWRQSEKSESHFVLKVIGFWRNKYNR